jgi:hypothetical protein
VASELTAERVKNKAQKNTQIQPTDCPKHEFRLATVGANEKGDKLTYVFFCIHCLYRTVLTDTAVIEPKESETPKQGEETNG